MIKKKITYVIVIGVMALMLQTLYGQFIEDNGSTTKRSDKTVEKYRNYVVKNIKVNTLENNHRSVEISWKTELAYTGELLIGRSTTPIDSVQKALMALNIGRISAGKENKIYDKNLKPGKYYYVILTVESIQYNVVKLIGNSNYTLSGITIFDKPHKQKKIISKTKNPQVQNIIVKRIDNERVVISWKKIPKNNIIYTVYRNITPINSLQILETSRKVSLETDKGRTIDDNILKSGVYYYAVTVKNFKDKESFVPMPDKNYTTRGIAIKDRIRGIADNIKTVKISKNNVKISWDSVSGKLRSPVKGYEIYRLSKVISSLDHLRDATLVMIARKNSNFYIDKNLKKGIYYYTILVRFEDGSVDVTFYKGANVSTIPVEITELYSIDSISIAKKKKNKIEIKWSFTGDKGVEEYYLMKTSKFLINAAHYRSEMIVSRVKISDKKFILDSPKAGTYYFTLIPYKVSNVEGYTIVKGRNSIKFFVEESLKDKKTNLDILSKKKNQKDLKKSVSGAKTKKTVIKKLPKDNRNNLIDDKKNISKKTIDKKKSVTKKKAISKRKGIKSSDIEMMKDVDAVIAQYFYKEDYSGAIKELQRIVKTTDIQRVKAKALLFIGRTYSELGKNKKALQYFYHPDVEKEYPEDSKFWSEFILLRLNHR